MFFRKNLEFFKTAKCGKFFVECVSKGYYFFKMPFHLICEIFWLKIRKFLKLEKLENMIRNRVFWKKTHLLKRHLYQNGRRKTCRWKPAVLFLIFFYTVIFNRLYTQAYSVNSKVKNVDSKIGCIQRISIPTQEQIAVPVSKY